jgi:hypothetical protein
VHQQIDPPTRPAVVCDTVNRRYPPVDEATTLVLDRSPYGSYLANICVSTMQGTTAQTEPGIYEMVFVEPDRTAQMLHRTPGRIRLIVTTDGARVRVNRLVRADPALRDRITVELMILDEPRP